MSSPEPRVHIGRIPRRGPTPGGPRPLLVVGRGRPTGRDVRVLVELGILRLGPPRAPVPSRRGAGGARPMSYRSAAGAWSPRRRTRPAARGRAGCSGSSSSLVRAAGAAPPRRRRALRCPPAVDALWRCCPASCDVIGQPFTTFTADYRQTELDGCVALAFARPTSHEMWQAQRCPRRPGGAAGPVRGLGPVALGKH